MKSMFGVTGNLLKSKRALLRVAHQFTLTSPRCTVPIARPCTRTGTSTFTRAFSSEAPEMPQFNDRYFEEVWATNKVYGQVAHWCEFYERPKQAQGLHHMELVHPDIDVDSVHGKALGMEAYAGLMDKVHSSTENERHAHHLQADTIVMKMGGGMYELEVEVAHHKEVDDKLIGTRQRFTFLLKDDPPSLLPKIIKVESTELEKVDPEHFVDSYADNRVASFVHNYLTLFDHRCTRDGDASAFEELFVEDDRGLQIQKLSGGKPFRTFQDWADSFGTLPDYLAKSCHMVREITAFPLALNTYEADMVHLWVHTPFDEEGEIAEHPEPPMSSRHSWTLKNDPADRYLKLHKLKSEILPLDLAEPHYAREE